MICGSLRGVLEVLPSVERIPALFRGDGLGAAAAAEVGEAAERVDDGLAFLPPPAPLLPAPPKRASRLEAWSRL